MSRPLRPLATAALLALTLASCGDSGSGSNSSADVGGVVGTAPTTASTPTTPTGPVPAWAKQANHLCRTFKKAEAKATKRYEDLVATDPQAMVDAAAAIKPFADDLVAKLHAVDAPPQERWNEFVGAIAAEFDYARQYAKSLRDKQPLAVAKRDELLSSAKTAADFLTTYPVGDCRPPL